MSSTAEIITFSKEKHKPRPDFKWNGPLENYYKDGCCYYTQYSIIATCNTSGDESEKVIGKEENSIRRALANLSERCSCGNKWHYVIN